MRYLPYVTAFALFMTPFLTINGSIRAATSQPATVETDGVLETREEDPTEVADEEPSLACDLTGCP